jgi:hypothetical protein
VVLLPAAATNASHRENGCSVCVAHTGDKTRERGMLLEGVRAAFLPPLAGGGGLFQARAYVCEIEKDAWEISVLAARPPLFSDPKNVWKWYFRERLFMSQLHAIFLMLKRV